MLTADIAHAAEVLASGGLGVFGFLILGMGALMRGCLAPLACLLAAVAVFAAALVLAGLADGAR